jgi:hypothetical protein
VAGIGEADSKMVEIKLGHKEVSIEQSKSKIERPIQIKGF